MKKNDYKNSHRFTVFPHFPEPDAPGYTISAEIHLSSSRWDTSSPPPDTSRRRRSERSHRRPGTHSRPSSRRPPPRSDTCPGRTWWCRRGRNRYRAHCATDTQRLHRRGTRSAWQQSSSADRRPADRRGRRRCRARWCSGICRCRRGRTGQSCSQNRMPPCRAGRIPGDKKKVYCTVKGKEKEKRRHKVKQRRKYVIYE